jgi:hypothetical protein
MRRPPDYISGVPVPRPRRWLLATLAGCLALAACGTGASTRRVGVVDIPLATGVRILVHVLSCDRGANPYCAEQLVAVGHSYPDSFAVLMAERKLLRRLHWSFSVGDTGKEIAAESPGHELRLMSATAYNDLLALDQSWIRRTAPIGRALSQALIDRAPAISLMLQRGSS